MGIRPKCIIMGLLASLSLSWAVEVMAWSLCQIWQLDTAMCRHDKEYNLNVPINCVNTGSRRVFLELPLHVTPLSQIASMKH
jgi:hypothetical protein